MLDLDRDATIALLGRLQDGSKPLQPGDHFTHPTLGRMRVSRVLGWKDGFQLAQRGGKTHFDPCRSLTITAFREGAKKAERITFLPPKATKKTGANDG